MTPNYPKKTQIRKNPDAITIPAKRTDRIQKVLANLGLGSRREIEEWIKQKRLWVNSHMVNLGDKISGKEIIKLDSNIIWPKGRAITAFSTAANGAPRLRPWSKPGSARTPDPR